MFKAEIINEITIMNQCNSFACTFPVSIAIETVNYCNAKCIFCPLFFGEEQLDRKARPLSVMDLALFEKIVKEISAWKVKPLILLNMDGEPLLDKKLPERLRILKTADLSYRTNLQTNGEFLTERISRDILSSNLGEITLGFDGATKGVYELHRVGCHYERVISNLRNFVRLRKSMKAPTRVAIKYVRTVQNVHEIKAAYNLFASFLDPWIDLFRDTGSVNWAVPSLNDVALRTSGGEEPKYCGVPAKHMIVLVDGRVPACCYDYNLTIFGGSLGDVREKSLLQIWSGPKFEELRRVLIKHDPLKPAKCLECCESFPAPKYVPDPAIVKNVRSRGHDFDYYFAGPGMLRGLKLLSARTRSDGIFQTIRHLGSLCRSVAADKLHK